MGRRGTAATPVALRLTKPGERAPVEPGRRLGAPTPPDDLSPAALAEWRRIVPELERLGLLAITEDQQPLAEMCELVAELASVRAELRVQGRMVERKSGLRVPNNLLSYRLQLSQRLLSFSSRFGLTPADRVGMKLSPQPEGDEREELFK